MQGDIIAALQAEKAELERKLSAIRGVLAAYGDQAVAEVAPARKPFVVKPNPATARMTDYGRMIRKEVAEVLTALHPVGIPTPVSVLVEMLQERGVEIRGQDPRNALSAILSRDPDVKNHGRSGWTLSDAAVMKMIGFGPKENEPHSASAGGSDAETEGLSPPPDLMD